MKKILPALSVVLSGVLWGLISIFIKKLSAAGFTSLQICLIRMFFSAIIVISAVAIFSPKSLKIKLKDIWIFICTGIVSVVLFNVCYFYTIIHSQASVAVVLLYTSPIFVMILSAIFFKEKITWIKIVALVLTFVGCLFVAGIFNTSYSLTFLVILSGIGAGLFYALYSIFGRVALQKYDSLTLTCYTFLFGFIGSLPIGDVVGTVQNFVAQPILILWGVGISVVSTVLPYFFYSWGLQRMESGKASILAASEPLVGAVIGMTLYQEPGDPLKIIGIVLILVSIVCMNVRFPKKRI